MKNYRETIKIIVNLSHKLINVSLTIICLDAAFLLYCLNNNISGHKTIFFFVSFLILIFSIVFGGKGIAILYKTIGQKKGGWSDGDEFFQVQTLFLIAGILFFFASSVLMFVNK